MKKNYSSAFLLSLCLLAGFSQMKAQKAFQRGSLMVSISEGSTISSYKTQGITGSAASNSTGMYKSHENGDIDDSHPVEHGEPTVGVRDPLIVEYGITNKISLGFSSGADIFTVDPSKFYGFKRMDGAPVTAKTEEFTFDGSYHFYVNKRLDLSAFGGLGVFGVAFKSQEADDAKPVVYKASGSMARGGLRVRYYFFRRLGAFGQVSSYTGKCSSKNVKENNLPGEYSTTISGSAIEAGLCYRFIR